MGLDAEVNRTVIHHIAAAKDGAGRVTGNDGSGRDGHLAQDAQESGARVKKAAADIGESINSAARKLR